MTGAKHTSPAAAELVDGDASHEQHQSLPLPHREVPLQYEPHQQCYHQNLQGVNQVITLRGCQGLGGLQRGNGGAGGEVKPHSLRAAGGGEGGRKGGGMGGEGPW